MDPTKEPNPVDRRSVLHLIFNSYDRGQMLLVREVATELDISEPDADLYLTELIEAKFVEKVSRQSTRWMRPPGSPQQRGDLWPKFRITDEGKMAIKRLGWLGGDPRSQL